MGIDMTPGFYQGRRTGLQTGRVSPRDAIRPSRSDLVDAAHGIVSTGQIDPNQGQLFNSHQITARSHTDILAGHNVPDSGPMGNHKGFMPGVRRFVRGSKTEIDPVATRAAKAQGVRDLGAARVRTGLARGSTPVKESMEDRSALLGRSQERDWYAGRDVASGHLTEGAAGHLIEGMAQRQGVSHSRATRAVAITSARTKWDEVNAGPTGRDYGVSRPNLESAENVVTGVQRLGPDPSQAAAHRAGGEASGAALNGMKAKAGVEFAKGEPRQPIPVASRPSAKVPNFEPSLHLGHASKHVQQQSAKSYTVDAWDNLAGGGDEELLKKDTGYHTQAMLGRRSSLKAGELGPRGQSMKWETIRRESAPVSMGDHGLFTTDRKGGIVPNPTARPGAAMRHSLHGHDDRSPEAKRLGIEF